MAAPGLGMSRVGLGVSPAAAIAVVMALLAVAPAVASGYYAYDVLAKAMILALLAVALDLAWGYGGILSLGHSAFFGLGSYAMGILLLHWDSSAAWLLGFMLAVLLPALLAAVVGWFVFFGATSTLYVAIVTLALPVLLSALSLRIPELTGGLTGLSGIASFPWSSALTTYYVLLAVLLLVTLLAYAAVRSDFGRLLVAVRDNEQRARFLGYRTPLVRLLVFAASAALAGFAGALYAPYNGFVNPDLVSLLLSTGAIAWVAIGGRGTLAGALLGALLINVLEPVLNEGFPGYWQVLLGLVFILVILVFPGGLFGLLSGRRTALRSVEVTPAGAASGRKRQMELAVKDLDLAFGSLKVLRQVTLAVRTGVLHCMIGPNGAGKSTLVNVITGLLRPSAGQVLIDGHPVPPGHPGSVARRGVLRTFQASNVFETLSVGDNLFLAARAGALPGIVRYTPRVPLPPQSEQILQVSGLVPKLPTRAGDLGHGERKWLELCMVLAADPAIVFLDEPTAGLSTADRAKAGTILVDLVRTHGLGLLLIEHDLDFVKAIAERLTVLSDGELVADGDVQAVADSPVVQQIYVGRDAGAPALMER